MWKEGYTTGKDGVRIFYRMLEKKGPWVVFVHGGTGCVSALFKQQDFFSKRDLSLLFIDLRGHGNSDHGSGEEFFKISNFAADINAVLIHLGIRKATLIGHCFGSFVVQEFARDYAEKVERLVLINSADHIMKSRLMELAYLAFFWLLRLVPYKGRKGHGDYTRIIGSMDVSPRRVYTDIKYCGFETYSEVMVESLKFMSPIRKGFRKPTLLIHGKKDFLISYKRTIELGRLFRNPKIVLLNTNHVAVINDAKNVNIAILDFLTKRKKFLKD